MDIFLAQMQQNYGGYEKMKMKMDDNVAIVENAIQVGHANALSREYLSKITGMSDRMVRRAIELSTKPIVNMGYGYFIPDENDSVDRAEAHAYRQQETARARSIIEKLDAKFAEFDAPEYEQLELDL